MPRNIRHSREFKTLNRIIETTLGVHPSKAVSEEEYRERHRRVHEALQDDALEVGFVFFRGPISGSFRSREHQ